MEIGAFLQIFHCLPRHYALSVLKGNCNEKPLLMHYPTKSFAVLCNPARLSFLNRSPG